MAMTTALDQGLIRRRVFETWSIEIPETFTETFVADDGYWHGYDAFRSVSMTSLLVFDPSGEAPLEELVHAFGILEGTPVAETPSGLAGHATIGPAIEPARASQILTGVLATHGRILLVTITSDDLAWARRIWLSIRHLPELEATSLVN